ncbi:MAG: acetyl/propionyl/methylcrotonyl-CoA carboxylase subunit alpha [Parvibaculaceae bacterium]
MFSSVLIANRGEIACRIIRTAKEMGLRTIAVYSDADADAAHVALADEAHHIGPSAANESYLKGDRLLEVAKAAGADAIHPGYGFLSENAGFAEACEAAGIIFVGPTAEAIRAMGLKDAAKALMEKANVPVVPGYHGDNQDPAFLAAEAEKIGYPVLIKAVAGGGGKGMRRVDDASEFDKALQSAQREAASAFGDDRVLVEKFVARPRHIEIQVFADAHGNAVHLFERDCSLQRRHQKVVEEAPAPDMPEDMRAAMGTAAVAAAKAIDYRGAGTIEFIADASEGLKADAFYFMEMNTRLQVEHPVTEMITGQDLVEWQFRVAAGEPLPCTQDDLWIDGHAVEVRLYAEDPAKKFFPSTGTLHRLRLPADDTDVRVDTGVREGDTVSMFYDPMIAKLIVWDATRTGALRRMARALETIEIAGLRSNAAFLAEIVQNPSFIAGDIDTGFIDAHLEELVPSSGMPEPELIALAAFHELAVREAALKGAAGASDEPSSPWAAADGWALGGSRTEPVPLEVAGEAIAVSAHHAGAQWQINLDGAAYKVSGTLADGSLTAQVNGKRIAAGVIELGRGFVLMHKGVSHEFSRPDPLDVDLEEQAGGNSFTAPLPGKVIQVLVKAGDKVRKGSALVVLEAMKMEQTIQAQSDGIVELVAVGEGDQVEAGATLVRFEEPAA